MMISMEVLLLPLLLLLLWSSMWVTALVEEEWEIRLEEKSTRSSSVLTSIPSPVVLTWYTAGDLTDDRYFIRLTANTSHDASSSSNSSSWLYRSGEHFNPFRQTSPAVGGSFDNTNRAKEANYEVHFDCNNAAGTLCDDGTFHWKLVSCGCPDDAPDMTRPCRVSPFAKAKDAECQSCPSGTYLDKNNTCVDCAPGTYKSAKGNEECTPCEAGSFTDRFGSTSCEACPVGEFSTTGSTECQRCGADVVLDPILLQGSLIDFTGRGTCPTFTSVGYWTLAGQGSVGPGRTKFEWQLSKAKSASNGVRHTSEFAEAFRKAQGETTWFETVNTEGWTVSAGVSGGWKLFGASLGVERTIEKTTTSLSKTNYELSTAATSVVSSGTTSVIANKESVACSQSCGYDPSTPDRVNGFVYNWVEVLLDDNLDANQSTPIHFVRTCRAVCKYDNIPPLCPPGYCANRACDFCLEGAFFNTTVDAIATGRAASAATDLPQLPPSEGDNHDAACEEQENDDDKDATFPSKGRFRTCGWLQKKLKKVKKECKRGGSDECPKTCAVFC